MAYNLARTGRTAQANRYITELEQFAEEQYVSPAALFWAYLGIGDLDRTFIMLNRAVDENVFVVLMELTTSPLLDELRNDLRFINVLNRLGLDETASN